MLPIVEKDPWLRPVEHKMAERHNAYLAVKKSIEKDFGTLAQYADWHKYLGFNYDAQQKGWYFREWLPRAEYVYLMGDFNDWELCRNPLQKIENGIWEIFLPDDLWSEKLRHNSRIKLYIKGKNGWQQRIPAYIRYAKQDEVTKDFCGIFYNPPTSFDWEEEHFDIKALNNLLIYECHVGMAQEKEGIGTYAEFTRNILPRIKSEGYNTLQIMAIAEHPYYGSFGYHVSNFFAPSSRFGTPDELKNLIKEAHRLGLAVVMDLVHSHFVENTLEGLNMLDGEEGLYCYAGEKGNHPHWKSKIFDYSKPEVQRFLLSNIRYWMEEFHFDGFRFDGVTSMLYSHHGYIDEFGSYDCYFGDAVQQEAISYLTLANDLIHSLKPDAVTIAEEVSGMPGVAIPVQDGGIGFDYRMAMAIPDFWIKLLKDQTDEQWNLEEMWHTMTDRLWNVKTIAYCESHDQALVGDKTIAFRLMDKAMYNKMRVDQHDLIVERGIALHKLIRFFTISLGGQAYLNFMGNEFGHPEWIDFPRQGNGWSYAHARRQWNLADDENLRYKFMYHFDNAMLEFIKSYQILASDFAIKLHIDEENKTICFERAGLIFVFNWHPTKAIPNYRFYVRQPGKYKLIFHTDAQLFGGYNRLSTHVEYFTSENKNQTDFLQIYNVNRSAMVFMKAD